MEQDLWDQRYAGSELVWTAQPNRFVVEELAGQTPGRALDLGTGEGRNAVWLAGQGWQVTAVDFSPVGLAKAARLAGSRDVAVDWVQADLRHYQPAQGSYDLVLLAYIHLPAAEFAGVLRMAAAALAPGGTLLVIGHDVDNISRGHGGPQDPAILHRAEDVVAGLPGLLIRRSGRARRPVQTPEGERVAIDTVVCAQRPGTRPQP